MKMPTTENTIRPKRLIAIIVFCACILLAATGLAATTSTQAAQADGQASSPQNATITDGSEPLR